MSSSTPQTICRIEKPAPRPWRRRCTPTAYQPSTSCPKHPPSRSIRGDGPLCQTDHVWGQPARSAAVGLERLHELVGGEADPLRRKTHGVSRWQACTLRPRTAAGCHVAWAPGARVTLCGLWHLIDRRRPSSTGAAIDGNKRSPPVSKGGRTGVDAKEAAMRAIRRFLGSSTIVGALVALTRCT